MLVYDILNDLDKNLKKYFEIAKINFFCTKFELNSNKESSWSKTKSSRRKFVRSRTICFRPKFSQFSEEGSKKEQKIKE